MFSDWDQFVGGHRRLNTFSDFSEFLSEISSFFLTSLDSHLDQLSNEKKKTRQNASTNG